MCMCVRVDTFVGVSGCMLWVCVVCVCVCVCLFVCVCVKLNQVSSGCLQNDSFDVGQQLLLHRPRCISQCIFGGSIATSKMGRSAHSRLGVSASLSLLQYPKP